VRRGRRRRRVGSLIIHFCPRPPSPRPDRSSPIRPAAARPVNLRRVPMCWGARPLPACRRHRAAMDDAGGRRLDGNWSRGRPARNGIRAHEPAVRLGRPARSTGDPGHSADLGSQRGGATASGTGATGSSGRPRWERVWSAWPARRNNKASAATKNKRTTPIGNSSSTRARPRRIRPAVLEPVLPRARRAILPAHPIAAAPSAEWAAALRRPRGLRATSRLLPHSRRKRALRLSFGRLGRGFGGAPLAVIP